MRHTLLHLAVAALAMLWVGSLTGGTTGQAAGQTYARAGQGGGRGEETSRAGQRVSVGFYNVENLYDTIPSRFYDDSDYTPAGRYRWDAERYGTKLRNVARVVDDMALDVLGICEVESETAVRDLVLTLADDYNYIHRTSGDGRGMDLALLYKGDKFFPSDVDMIDSGAPRGFLHVRGELIGQQVSILVCHLPSNFNSQKRRRQTLQRLANVADSLSSRNPETGVVIMGDFNSTPSDKMFRGVMGESMDGFYTRTGLYGVLDAGAASGFGTYAWDDEWVLYDQILISLSLRFGAHLVLRHGGVFVREYMLSSGDEATSGRRGYPLRTMTGGRYTAGYSDHLPVFAIFGRPAER